VRSGARVGDKAKLEDAGALGRRHCLDDALILRLAISLDADLRLGILPAIPFSYRSSAGSSSGSWKNASILSVLKSLH
jgi:hypothetical protein